MEKEFIPYEQALALKELGFDKYCLGLYAYASRNTVDMELVFHTCKASSKLNWMRVPAPTFSQAFRWFREKHQKNIVIFSDGYQWTFDLRWVDEDSLDKYPTIQFPKREVGREWFNTYEEAELECLKKLIEIVKNN